MRGDGMRMRVRLCVRILDGGGGGSLLEADAGAGELELNELARLSSVVAKRQRQLLQVKLQVVGFVLCQWQTDRRQSVYATVSVVGAKSKFNTFSALCLEVLKWNCARLLITNVPWYKLTL